LCCDWRYYDDKQRYGLQPCTTQHKDMPCYYFNCVRFIDDACRLIEYTHSYGGTRWRTWLRHYVTRRKVAGSILDEVIEFFNWPIPSSRTMALGSTQPLTEMSTRNLLGGEGRPAHRADNRHLWADCLENVGSLDVSQPYGPSRSVTRISLPLFTHSY
jgi:hypothetical protein